MKKQLFLLLLICSSLVWAADNSTYIDQSGDYTSVLVQQDGAGNTVRGITGTSRDTPAVMYGDSNYINIEQKGSGNTLGFAVQTKSASDTMSWTSEYTKAEMTSNSYVATMTGNSNTILIDSNGDGKSTSYGNGVYLQQVGNSTNVSLILRGTTNGVSAGIFGNSNTFNSAIEGSNNIQDVYIIGDSNSLSLTQTGDGNGVIGGVGGFGNTLSLNQQDFGRTVRLEVSGNSNSITISQAGTSDSPVNLRFVGSNNFYNVNTNTR